jgi:hypothetical protein
MSARVSGIWLIFGASLFWVCWSLMPGVGITDAAQILDLVSHHREQVAASVILQLVSAVCYVPALVGLLSQPELGSDRAVRRAVILLLVGAMGSAADAVFHLLAHAMTAPGLDRSALLVVMEFMQGPGLRFVLPMIAAFFVGSIWLSIALTGRGVVSRWNPGLYALAFGTGLLGALFAARIGISARTVGLIVLALVAAAQIWIGLALTRTRSPVPGDFSDALFVGQGQSS